MTTNDQVLGNIKVKQEVHWDPNIMTNKGEEQNTITTMKQDPKEEEEVEEVDKEKIPDGQARRWRGEQH